MIYKSYLSSNTYISGLCLKYRFNLKKKNHTYYLQFFFSPYFRAGAIWTDDNILALIFFSISLFYFIKYEKNKSKTKYNTILFSCASCYLRPIYCIFSIYFLLFILLILNFRKIYFYILTNLLLAFTFLCVYSGHR